MKKSHNVSDLVREYLGLIVLSAGLIGYGICAKGCAGQNSPEGLEKKIEKSSRPSNSYKVEEKILYEYLQRVLSKEY